MERPKVFISYSYDSGEHEKWVLKLSTKLREKGVDAILDKWEVGLGDLMPPFMREGITDSDRVLIICTDAYVEKANALKDGVGYEMTIVDAELDQNLKTQKFIPVIRQASGNPKIPTSLGKRWYIDFRDDNEFDEKFDELLREIQGDPINPKPPLGEYSSANQSSEPEASSHHLSNISKKVESASDAYKAAGAFIESENRFGWRQFVKGIHRDVSNSLEEWRPEFEQQRLDSTEKILEVVDKAVGIVSPLISVTLAAVESGEESFNDQKSVLRDLFTIVEWKNSTHTAWIDMPNALRYVYHSLHGGLGLKTYQLNLALNLARENVRVNYPSNSRGRVWEMRNLNGAYYFNVNAAHLWKYINSAYQKWKWLDLIFQDDPEYRASLVAYYMALNIHELAAKIDSADQEDLDNYGFKVPLDFLFETYKIKGRAVDILLSNPTLSELWTCLDIKQEQMKNSWKDWIYRCKDQFWNKYQGYHFENGAIHFEHENFFDNL